MMNLFRLDVLLVSNERRKALLLEYSLVTVDIHRIETENDCDIYESYLSNKLFNEMINDCDSEFNISSFLLHPHTSCSFE